MSENTLVERVEQLGGFEGRAAALAAIRAVLVSVGERLQDDERDRFIQELPMAVRTAMIRSAYRGDFDRDELFARVARHSGKDLGIAKEETEIVCQALTAVLPGEALTRLRKWLGPSIAEMFAEREPTESAPRSPGRSGRTLATGHEGSAHPLSEARPLDLAHAASVARSSGPHEDTKLASAHGSTQERLGETLASGRPGSKNPVSEGRS